MENSERFYGAKPVTLSGNNENDLIAINKWVKEATDGQISTFLSQLPESTVMLLLNAVHYQGELQCTLQSLLSRPLPLGEQLGFWVLPPVKWLHISQWNLL